MDCPKCGAKETYRRGKSTFFMCGSLHHEMEECSQQSDTCRISVLEDEVKKLKSRVGRRAGSNEGYG